MLKLKPQYLATWCEELTHWKRSWCWERLRAGGEGDDRGWDGWVASQTRWTWVWASSRSWWWTGNPGVLQFMGLQRVRHDWVTELNWCWILWITNIEVIFWNSHTIRMFIGTLNDNEKLEGKIKGLSTSEWINNDAFIHWMYIAMKKNELILSTTIWMNLIDTMLSERNQIQKLDNVWCY